MSAFQPTAINRANLRSPPGVAATLIAPLSIALAMGSASASPTVEIGAVINPIWQSAPQALLHRDRGLGLGHSEFSLGTRFTPWLVGNFSAVAHSDHQRIESTIEEAFLEVPALSGGLQLRGGRFLSQLGYLNESHPHNDDFVMRPVLHRAFLGNHYFDDGLRLNWVAPTDLYWRIGTELLRGKRLPSQPTAAAIGAYTISTRVGGDIGRETSWQVGVGTLRHRGSPIGAAGQGDEHLSEAGSGIESGPADHEPAQAHRPSPHSHGSVFFGRRMDVIEGVWKWSPDGNPRARQLRVSGEFARVSGFGEIPQVGHHSASYLSVVYRFRPQWEAGVRVDRLSALALHEDGYQPARMDEQSVSLAWKPQHSSTVRLQWSRQRDRGGFAAASEIAPGRAVHLQFVQSLGAHGSHAF